MRRAESFAARASRCISRTCVIGCAIATTRADNFKILNDPFADVATVAPESLLTPTQAAAEIAELAPQATVMAPAAMARTAAAQPASEPTDLSTMAEKVRASVFLVIVLDPQREPLATGSGFAVQDCVIVTNYHVVQGASSVVLKSEEGATYSVDGPLVLDGLHDLAALRVKGTGLKPLRLASSADAKPGQRIAVIGSPLGLEGTLSDGVISAKRERMLQITAAISPGSSGSPVVNMSGEVLGVARSNLKGGQSLNFAIPSDEVSWLLSGLDAGKPTVAWPPAETKSRSTHSGERRWTAMVVPPEWWPKLQLTHASTGGGQIRFSVYNATPYPVNGIRINLRRLYLHGAYPHHDETREIILHNMAGGPPSSISTFEADVGNFVDDYIHDYGQGPIRDQCMLQWTVTAAAYVAE